MVPPISKPSTVFRDVALCLIADFTACASLVLALFWLLLTKTRRSLLKLIETPPIMSQYGVEHAVPASTCISPMGLNIYQSDNGVKQRESSIQGVSWFPLIRG
jgi:hypothetical protein